MQRRQSTNIKGCDVSHWQGEVDWQKVKLGGVRFVYIKATEGTTFIDPLFETNVEEAKKAGLYVGAYHFARFGSKQEAISEARHFFSATKPYTLNLPHVLDLETDQGLDAKSLSLNAFLFLETLQTLTHVKPMLYSSTQFIKAHLTASLKNYPLWIAHYGRVQPGENDIWDKWTVFQYTNKGELSGIKGDVDLNEWVAADFHRLTSGDKRKKPTVTLPQNKEVTLSRAYKIQKGDTFWDLEAHNGWTHGKLQALNPGMDPRRLSIGQTIKIP